MGIRIENVVLPSPEQWKALIMGARNPMNSYDRYDSYVDDAGNFIIGPNDYDLMKRLCKAGTDHRKFMRMIIVYANVTAPLYWWKEADTYRMGLEKNSCSTMHKIHAKKFEMSDFSTEHLTPASFKCLGFTVKTLNEFREQYLETKNKDIWWQMIQLLPSSYNQRRTVMLSYEVLANIYKSRNNHKLDEWSDQNDFGFCTWIHSLPYSELITGDAK